MPSTTLRHARVHRSMSFGTIGTKVIAAMATSVVLSIAAAPSHAQHAGHSGVSDIGAETAVLGTIDFPNSGASDAQDAFTRGMLLLHSFEYPDALAAFQEAQRIDPDFALAHWGEAMSHNHPVWFVQDAGAATAALAEFGATPEARRARAPTEREKMYLDAVEALYGEGDKAARDSAHTEAMRLLHEAYPDDDEAAAFYALSILGSVPARDFRTYMRAGAVAERVFAANPGHPGAAHYMIHSFDDPIHPPLGLAAARRYSEIAPGASHAQHMVSHIYTALGMWDDVVEANRISVSVSEERLRRMGSSLASRGKHALLWLEYGLLQQGRFGEARDALATMEADLAEQPNPGHLFHYAAMRAAYIVADPTADDAPPPLESADASLFVRALDEFATGLSATARGDITGGTAALDRVESALATARTDAPDPTRRMYDGAVSADNLLVGGIMARQLEAILAFKDGDTESALEIAAAAAADEESRAIEYGPPTIVLPGRELLGNMLLELNRPADAIIAFQQSLERNTGRVQSLIGLARAAEAADQEDLGRRTRDGIRDIWQGDAGRLDNALAGMLP